MNLSTERAAVFHELHTSLLAYVNRQLNVLPGVNIGRDVTQHPAEDVVRLRDAFLEHPDLLDRYIAANPEHLSKDNLAIAAAWRYHIRGDFMVVRLLKAYGILMSTEEPSHLYGVLGLHNPLEEVLGGASLPLYVAAVLLPFQDQIIYDGLMTVRSIHFGPGFRSSINEQYNRLKESEGIIEQLVDAEGQPHILTSLARRKPRKPAPDWRPVIGEIVTKTEQMRQADSQLQAAALELLRVGARLAQATFNDPEMDLSGFLRQVRSAITKLQRQAER